MEKGDKIIYEWDWEQMGDPFTDFDGDESRDIEEHWRSDLPQDKPFDGVGNMVLIRDYWKFDGDLEDRQYAYVTDGQLPDEFDGGMPVPQKYREQFDKWNKGE